MKLRACLFGTLVVAAACGGDSSNDAKPDAPAATPDAPVVQPDAPTPEPDAPTPQYDFSCLGNTAPTTAPDPITVSGTVNDVNPASQTLQPVPDATVRGRSTTDQNVGQAQTSDADGEFTLTLPSGGAPLDGYIEATKNNYRTVRVYPPAPLDASQTGLPVLLLRNDTFMFVVSVLGAQQSPQNGTVAAVAVDCANTPIEGAEVKAQQNGQDVGMAHSAGAVQPGAVIFFDVPPGATTVSATYNGMTLRSHVVASVAEVTTTTAIRPGY